MDEDEVHTAFPDDMATKAKTHLAEHPDNSTPILVLEYFLADGRRHLHVWGSYNGNADGVRYNWLHGNWSHDCNRADEIVRDGVPDHGFTVDDRGCVVQECQKTIRLGWAILWHGDRVEVAIRPGED